MNLERVLEAVIYQEEMHWNQQFVAWNGHRNAGQDDNDDKPREGLGYKRSVNSRKASGMACIGRNSSHQKALL